ncbi:EKC/KEOPS complex subunit LAGE3-like [Choloepus didactylus]|uniref:EKC/KEOPS complex subunit LAGE3-like n=1 Tax=Choloepus didactylus TaxID=27675 RepID=UPI0018A0FA3A|nr:EKC/KEOPS complex subunit LAGE3-like [Choloepus didactylus]
MRAAYEGIGGAGGVVSAAEDLGVQGGPSVQGGPGGPNGQAGPGVPDIQGGPNGQGGPGGPGGLQGLCGGRGEGAMAGGAPQAPPVAGLGEEAAPAAGGPGSRLLKFNLSVPFRSPLEAEMARRSLISDVHHQGQMVQKELTVTGSVLVVGWTAEDPVVFRISINSFLDRLSLVMRNIERIGFPFPLSLGREKGSEA